LIACKSSLNQTSPPTPKLVCNFISSNTNMSADPQNEGGAFLNFQNHPKFTPQMANFFDVFSLILAVTFIPT